MWCEEGQSHGVDQMDLRVAITNRADFPNTLLSISYVFYSDSYTIPVTNAVGPAFEYAFNPYSPKLDINITNWDWRNTTAGATYLSIWPYVILESSNQTVLGFDIHENEPYVNITLPIGEIDFVAEFVSAYIFTDGVSTKIVSSAVSQSYPLDIYPDYPYEIAFEGALCNPQQNNTPIPMLYNNAYLDPTVLVLFLGGGGSTPTASTPSVQVAAIVAPIVVGVLLVAAVLFVIFYKPARLFFQPFSGRNDHSKDSTDSSKALNSGWANGQKPNLNSSPLYHVALPKPRALAAPCGRLPDCIVFAPRWFHVGQHGLFES